MSITDKTIHRRMRDGIVTGTGYAPPELAIGIGRARRMRYHTELLACSVAGR